MTTTYKVSVLVGSLRKGSYNRKLAEAMIKMAPPTLSLEIVEIGELPFYNEDIDNETPPASYTSFREKIRASDAILIVSPEYNRSVPAVLKNALDVGSRPYGKSVWNEKPTAVITSSTGAIGGFGANHHIRQSLVFLNMPCMQQPETYLGGIADAFDEAGNLNERTHNFVKNIVEAYDKWVRRLLDLPL